MRLPEFTAQASLGRTSPAYRALSFWSGAAVTSSAVFPSLAPIRPNCTWVCYWEGLPTMRWVCEWKCGSASGVNNPPRLALQS